MSTTYLTVNEAAKNANKSPSSIRRIIYPILDDDNHPDRHYIQPSPAKAKELRSKGENFAWRISDKLLQREIQKTETNDRRETKFNAKTSDQQSAVIIDILRKQLEIKDQQIAAQSELIHKLADRVHESNALMATFQQKLLPDGSSRARPGVVDAQTTTTNPEKGSQTTESAPQKPHWLFRKIF